MISFDFTYFKKIAFRLYSAIIPSSLDIKLVPIKGIIKYRLFIRMLDLQLSKYYVEGKEKHSGEKLSILYYGDKINFVYFSTLLFSETTNEKCLGKIGIKRIKKELKNLPYEADLVLIKTDRSYSGFLQKKGFITIPEWSDTWLEISDGLEDVIKRFKKSAKEDIIKIKKKNYTYEISKDIDKLSFFYNELYLPFISERYGQLALPKTMNLNFNEIKSLFIKDKGVLLLVKKDKEYIAGVVLVTYGKVASPIYMGIRTDIDFLSDDVGSTIYYFSIIWAIKNGYELMRFGDVRPFLNDGLFQYKRKWGMRLTKNIYRYGVVGLRAYNLNSKAVISFFKSNPFIYISKNKQKGFLYFNEKLLAQDIQNIINKSTLEGLEEIIIASTIDALKTAIKNFDVYPCDKKIKIPLFTTPNYSKLLSGIFKTNLISDGKTAEISITYVENKNETKIQGNEEIINELLEKYNLNVEQSKQIISEGFLIDFKKLIEKYPNFKNILVRIFLITIPQLEKEGIDIKSLNYEIFDNFLTYLKEGKYSKEADEIIFKYLMEQKTKNIDKAISECGLSLISEEEVEKYVEKVVLKKTEYIKQHGALCINPLMGLIMKDLRGKADGKIISKILHEKIKYVLENKNP